MERNNSNNISNNNYKNNSNNSTNNNSTDDEDDIFEINLNKSCIEEATRRIKIEKIRELKENIHDFYNVLCFVIIFLSLYFLYKYQFLCSALITISIFLLLFKHNVLPLVFKMFDLE